MVALIKVEGDKHVVSGGAGVRRMVEAPVVDLSGEGHPYMAACLAFCD